MLGAMRRLRERDRRAVRAILLGMATFAFCVFAGWGIWKLTTLRRFTLDIATAADRRPGTSSRMTAAATSTTTCCCTAWTPTRCATCSEADVLLMGNSRLMFALRGDALRQYFVTRGLRPFALGFGHEEQHQFPLEVMRRHGLRPRVVIANVDNFFGGVTSPWGERVLRDTRFDAWKTEIEATAAHVVRRAMHRVVPHVPDLWDGEREFIIYRSERDGAWFIATEFGRGSRLERLLPRA